MRYLWLLLLPVITLGQFRPPSLGWNDGAPLYMSFDGGNGNNYGRHSEVSTNQGALFAEAGRSPYAKFSGTQIKAGNNLMNGGTAVTFACWVYVTNTTAQASMINAWDNKLGDLYNTYALLFTRVTGSNSFNFIVRQNNNNATELQCPMVINQWVHVIATADGFANLRLYTNGLLATEASWPSLLELKTCPANVTWEVGGTASATSRDLQGFLDEVQVLPIYVSIPAAKYLYEQALTRKP